MNYIYLILFVAIIYLSLSYVIKRLMTIKIINTHEHIIKYTIPQNELRDYQDTDKDNVHNRKIQEEISNTIIKLDKDKREDTNREISIYDVFKDDINIINILDQIKQLNCQYNDKLTEMDVILLVWDRLSKMIKRYRTDDEIITLFKNTLLDFKSLEPTDTLNLHCLSGRIARVIQCLQHVDIELPIFLCPLWLIKDLIVNKIIKYKDQSSISISMSINDFRQQLSDEFITQGLLTIEQFNEIVNPYFDYMKTELDNC